MRIEGEDAIGLDNVELYDIGDVVSFNGGLYFCESTPDPGGGDPSQDINDFESMIVPVGIT